MSIVVGFQSAATSDGRQQYDGATAILIDGCIYSLPEAYLSRKKHDGNVQLSLEELLRAFNLTLSDVDHFCVSTCGEESPSPSGIAYLRTDRRLSLQDLGVPNRKISWAASHHYSHALEGIMSMATLIGWQETLDKNLAVFVGDRIGQPGEFQTLFTLSDGKMQVAWRQSIENSEAAGFCRLYDDLACYLGFSQFDAGKVMALGTSYCGPAVPREIFSIENNSLRLNDEFQSHGSVDFFSQILRSQAKNQSIDEAVKFTAACLQSSMEACVSQIIENTLDGDLDGAIITGGIGQNCHLVSTVSRKLRTATIGGLCPGDSGQGIGNILQFLCPDGNLKNTPQLPNLQFFKRKPIVGQTSGIDLVGLSEAAEIISQGGVLLALGDRIEPGPRALGYHSILADARRSDNKRLVSEQIKGREGFRPLGAIVHDDILDQQEKRFQPSAFMDSVVLPEQGFLQNYPAVVHADGSVRIQRLSPITKDTKVEKLVQKLANDYGIYAIINTSLNMAGDPLDITGLEADYAPGKLYFV